MHRAITVQILVQISHFSFDDNIKTVISASYSSRLHLVSFLHSYLLILSTMSTTMKNTSEIKANRVPPSTNKRHGSARKEVPHAKRHKPASPMDCEPQFQKLDPKDAAHTKRMIQRRKTVSKGKNTAGYECYIKQVPTEKRRLRSMETPMTPDATLDIPSKRWQGLVKAW
jgi:hypothetical protein